MMPHTCPWPETGCTNPDCQVAAARYNQRVAEALYRVDHQHQITAATLGEVTCRLYPGWHSFPDHRRHVAEEQVAELQRCLLIDTKAFGPAVEEPS